ncbi:MAG TPA: hypothetical protein VH107_14715 [Lacipirellulaceae bacterium]|nr:hypothetical protein [Lacipirellulaceae bacterium]
MVANSYHSTLSTLGLGTLSVPLDSGTVTTTTSGIIFAPVIGTTIAAPQLSGTTSYVGYIQPIAPAATLQPTFNYAAGNLTAISSKTAFIIPTTATLTPSPSETYITGVTISMYLNTPVTLLSYTRHLIILHRKLVAPSRLPNSHKRHPHTHRLEFVYAR